MPTSTKKPSGRPTAARASGKKTGPQAADTKWSLWKATPDDALEELCDRIQGGESQAAVAESLGVDRAELHRWVAAESQRSARVQLARANSAVVWDEKAEHEIRAAFDPFELSKAKELAHHYRWRASKISPAYGDKVQHGGAEDLPPIAVTGDLTLTPLDAYMRLIGKA